MKRTFAILSTVAAVTSTAAQAETKRYEYFGLPFVCDNPADFSCTSSNLQPFSGTLSINKDLLPGNTLADATIKLTYELPFNPVPSSNSTLSTTPELWTQSCSEPLQAAPALLGRSMKKNRSSNGSVMRGCRGEATIFKPPPMVISTLFLPKASPRAFGQTCLCLCLWPCCSQL